MSNAQQYTDLLMSLLQKRDAVGGTLSAAEEAEFATRLDYCWSAMTPDEQAAAERRFRCEP